MSIKDWAEAHDIEPKKPAIKDLLDPIKAEVIDACADYTQPQVRQWLADDEGVKVGATALRIWLEENR